jgi:hypothetical protein
MDYDDVIRDAAVALWQNEAVRAAPNVAKNRNAETWNDVNPCEQDRWLQQARAVAPILAEYGARLMLTKIAACKDGTHLDEFDPETIVKEAVK